MTPLQHIWEEGDYAVRNVASVGITVSSWEVAQMHCVALTPLWQRGPRSKKLGPENRNTGNSELNTDNSSGNASCNAGLVARICAAEAVTLQMFGDLRLLRHGGCNGTTVVNPAARGMRRQVCKSAWSSQIWEWAKSWIGTEGYSDESNESSSARLRQRYHFCSPRLAPRSEIKIVRCRLVVLRAVASVPA